MAQANVRMTPNGRVVIPANMRAELGWQTGGKRVARLVDGACLALARSRNLPAITADTAWGSLNGFDVILIR
jgi:PIN domain nuclease of toxin-antitoxin system